MIRFSLYLFLTDDMNSDICRFVSLSGCLERSNAYITYFNGRTQQELTEVYLSAYSKTAFRAFSAKTL